MTEMVIQQLLTDAGADGIDTDLVSVDAATAWKCAADWRTLRSSETYVGYGQSAGFASAGCRSSSTSRRAYAAPALCDSTSGGCPGTWTVARHAGLLARARRARCVIGSTHATSTW